MGGFIIGDILHVSDIWGINMGLILEDIWVIFSSLLTIGERTGGVYLGDIFITFDNWGANRGGYFRLVLHHFHNTFPKWGEMGVLILGLFCITFTHHFPNGGRGGVILWGINFKHLQQLCTEGAWAIFIKTSSIVGLFSHRMNGYKIHF